MLYTVLLLPNAIPTDPLSHDWDLLLVFLRQVSINGLLLVDRNRELLKNIEKRITDCAPADKQVSILKLLSSYAKPEHARVWQHPEWIITKQQLESINNIVFFKIPSRQVPINIHLMITGVKNGVIPEKETQIHHSCPRNSGAKEREQWSKITANMALSSTAFSEMCINSYVIDPVGSRSKVNGILQPLFLSADRLDIYDRNIGSSFRSKNDSVPIATNYEKGLSELLYFFCVYSFKKELTINIYTNFDRNINQESILNLLNQLYQRSTHALAVNSVFSNRSLEINIRIDRRPDVEMRHNRYVCTNQIIISIDRGADFIQTNKRPRPSDYAVVTRREIFDGFINNGWTIAYQISRQGEIKTY